ncbi:MAG TPA: SdpI family protein [Roseiflexaceae bacterium]|jgi:uncharacterized membrane protein|nr:SdpI family protein [Roseiflexaceae bacterium]
MRSRWFAPLCIAAMIIFGAVIYNQLPAQVPMHWGINGQVDRTGSRLEGALLLPLLSIGVWLLMRVLPRIDPRRASYAEFQDTFNLFINIVILFLAALYVVMLGSTLGWNISVPQVVGVGVGLLLAVLGNEMGRVKPNWFVGIRTPWTLADPEVWRRTHRVGGRIFFVAGLVMAAVALLLPAYLFAVILVCVLVVALAPTVYSYVVWRQRPSA